MEGMIQRSKIPKLNLPALCNFSATGLEQFELMADLVLKVVEVWETAIVLDVVI
jgi:hypothetical protein